MAMIPEFTPVVGRVHHDLYHVYTVDVHSVAAVDRLRALVRGDLANEYPLACRLAAEVTRPAVLFFATLLHDVGKAIGGKDHSKRGAEMARGILTRLGLPPDDVEEGCHLILQHLLMYHVATRRDLDDQATVSEFAREVHGREGLRDLYLLTVADLSTTSPTSMTTWKARMLDELFLATDAQLSGQPVDEGRVARNARAGAQGVDGSRRRSAFLDAFMATMPERYLLSNSPAEIAAHARLALRRADATGHRAAWCRRATPRPPSSASSLADRPGLLAAITAAIAASRLEVHTAQIHSRTLPDGTVQAVDLFWVRDRVDGAEGVPARCPSSSAICARVITRPAVSHASLAAAEARLPLGRAPAPPVTHRGRRSTTAPRRGRRSSRSLTRDRPGLLFTLADALHELGLSIAVAKINTEGNRVADVFYVTEADGSKIEPGPEPMKIRARLLSALDDLAKEGKH